MTAEARRTTAARLPLPAFLRPRANTGSGRQVPEPVAPALYAARRSSGSQRKPLSFASAASASAVFLSVT